MLRGLLQGQAKKTYCGTGLLLLILIPFYLTRPLSWSAILDIPLVACLAALSCTFAVLQDGIPLPARIKTLVAWSYGIGTMLLLTAWPLSMRVRDPAWSRRLGIVDLVIPGMILLAVGAVFLGVFRNRRAWPERAYSLGGLCLVVLFLGKVWHNLFSSWFVEFPNPAWFMAGLLWMPACLLAANVGMLLGCLPHEVHLPSRRGSVMAICYLIAAALVPLGYYASVTWQNYDADAVALLAILTGIFVPASVVTRSWIIFRFGEGSH